jgi:S1-C subfamily serine protease
MRKLIKSVSLSVAIVIFGGASVQAGGLVTGSGVVVRPSGDVLTNTHVVENCTEIIVRFSSGQVVAASLVASDDRSDLAVVRPIGMNSFPASVAHFREGIPLRAGDTVIALGYPLSNVLTKDAQLSLAT